MSGPTAVIPRDGAPAARPGARSGTLLFTCEAFAYLFWLGIDVLASPGLSDPGTFAYSGPVAGALVAAVALSRYRWSRSAAAAVAMVLSALLSLAAVVTGGPPEVSLAELFALAVVTVSTVRVAAGGVAVLTAAGAFLVIVGMPALRFATDGVDWNMSVAVTGLGWASTVAVAAVLREVRVRREARLAEARTGERLELARELHDVVAHHVTGIVVAAQAAVTVARTRPEEAGPALESIERAGAEALAGMRRMVGLLRGGEDAGRTVAHGPSDVDELVDRFDPDRTRTVLERDAALGALPPGVGATAYRVVQETLTNVHRHTPDATSVRVALLRRNGSLEVTVRNDGGAPDRTQQALGRGGFGLAGMAERVGALGGTLRVGPDGPGAWTVLVELPLDGAR
ncbi:Two-component system sensor kinase [Pseudonocardia sp. Ae168_Ps1]|uniref:sensor histidine kinase n=1 Tax=unclassified Pseudonocardia TaxID=2619320 RepID=UPI0009667603|nr:MULTISPECIES: histidine kinase [unclassified Pseudonocardia]OLL74538.1 Two-component system sensor kinase [Pseudonocardia sp. Ae150A_Ps1]OLL80518.1 Two-component system sensor kinase [Pseudonocardia sp. Ae168_Ps1]OLL85354.1 Two-component system sensor kinase [Pseudonocardia sp. Ae263_Ps1]OLL94619.1 Two-component system sensor kinase [Pseudonocardia sp. Ae356_Ps1]